MVGRVESGFSVTDNFEDLIDHNETKFKNTENSQDTIRHILTSYDIGQKLRQLRLRKKIALVDLGKHTGLSASMLSQLENGKLIPTLPTLARIAMVFDVGLDRLCGPMYASAFLSYPIILSLAITLRCWLMEPSIRTYQLTWRNFQSWRPRMFPNTPMMALSLSMCSRVRLR